MANRETSDEISSLAANVLKLQPSDSRNAAEKKMYNDLLRDAKRLAGSALSQDQTPGKRKVGKLPALAAPYQGHPSIRLREITDNMRAKIVDYSDSEDSRPMTEATGFLLEAFEQYAHQIDAVRAEIGQSAAGTTAYDMVAAVETQHVEVTETLINMVAATVLARLIDEEGGGRANITFSPADMDAMHQRYEMTATRDGMLTTIKIEPRPGAFPPLALSDRMGTDDSEPALPQAEEHVFSRPLWAVRVEGNKLYPCSDRAAAEQRIEKAMRNYPDAVAEIENRWCYHNDCPASGCNRDPDKRDGSEVASGS